MATKAEGIWACKVLGGNAGIDDTGAVRVQIHVMITDGPNAGQRVTYEDQVNTRSARFVGASCRAVGWKGSSLSTLAADIAAWIAAGDAVSTVEIKHIEIKNGKRAGQIWDKPNSIGRGQARQLAEVSGTALADADEAMRAAMGGDTGSTPSEADYAPPASSRPMDDVPFMSRLDGSPIARVLR